MQPLKLLCVLLLAVLCCTSALAATVEQWKGRQIYQLLTDRFARSDSSTAPCSDLSRYCGGTFSGIARHLDYIRDLGFDAIWISPVVANQPHSYHGYHASDLFQINPSFGGEAGLREMVSAAHQRGMLVMVDVVANHMGIPPNYDYSGVVPFNHPSHYHSCDPCPRSGAAGACSIADWQNQLQIETCRLAGLPDLNQTVPFVRQTLLNWVSDLVRNYSLDGLRIDSVPEVSLDFWVPFAQAAGVYTLGEVANGNMAYAAGYQRSGARGGLDGVLHDSLAYILGESFGPSRVPMRMVGDTLLKYVSSFPDAAALGTFLEQHDEQRFLHKFSSPSAPGAVGRYRSALLISFYSLGIPVAYYGSEQLFAGASPPQNHEPLWTARWDTSGEQFGWMQLLMNYRSHANLGRQPTLQLQLNDDHFLAFTRGRVLVLVTNSAMHQTRTLPPASSSGDAAWPYTPGQLLCNIFDPRGDCITVQPSGNLTVQLQGDEPKVYDLWKDVGAFVRSDKGREMGWFAQQRQLVGSQSGAAVATE